jgi:hypothetical protein
MKNKFFLEQALGPVPQRVNFLLGGFLWGGGHDLKPFYRGALIHSVGAISLKSARQSFKIIYIRLRMSQLAQIGAIALKSQPAMV